MNRKILLRDFIIANAAALIGGSIMFVGIMLQELNVIKKQRCAFLELTHMYCPGCGGSRAMLSMLHFSFIKSLVYNPAVLLGAILIIYYEVGVIITLLRNDGRYHFLTKMWPVYIYLIIIFVFFIIRNVLLVCFDINLINIAGTM